MNIFPKQHPGPGAQSAPDESTCQGWMADSTSNLLTFSDTKVLLIGDNLDPIAAHIRDQKPSRLVRLVSQETSSADETCVADWSHPPDAEFDFILIPFGMEQRDDASDILMRLRRCMTASSLLIFGTIMSQRASSYFLHIDTAEGIERFPTRRYIDDVLLKDFSYRIFGGRRTPKSGLENNTHIGQFFFRCQLRKPTLLLIWGESYTGKTSLSRDIGHFGIPSIEGDQIIREIIDREHQPKDLNWLSRIKERPRRRQIILAYNECSKNSRRAKSLFNEYLKWLPQDLPLLIMNAALDKTSALRFYEVALESGYSCWLLQRGDQLHQEASAAFTNPDLLSKRNLAKKRR